MRILPIRTKALSRSCIIALMIFLPVKSPDPFKQLPRLASFEDSNPEEGLRSEGLFAGGLFVRGKHG